MDIVERLLQYLSKATFSHNADRHAALGCVEELRAELAQSRAKCQAAEDTLVMSVPKFKHDELAEALDLAITKAEEAEAEVIKLRAELAATREDLDTAVRRNNDAAEVNSALHAELAALKAQQSDPVATINDLAIGVYNDLVYSRGYKANDPLYRAPPSTAGLIAALKQAREALVRARIGLRYWELPKNRYEALDTINESLAAIDEAMKEK